ncbi:class I SAM-dependent methyltransferase [Myxacorys almedinensis]|uniref:Methyltransferase domain-containing protein n=1 Tax=Myxacorys almedinensis A TaxID=2690445 RepID=A0A8J7Z860_9CYAN|nr:class I SAM-dependent methyltransferase [Myxacorys almedinensis]NDJ19921.1 methyltransferase domain-containing protein [Myxacorys almedinensis A]
MPDTLTKLAYQTFQQGKSVFGLAHKALGVQLTNLVAPLEESKSVPISPEILSKIQQRYSSILEADWQDAEQGVYPETLLFDNPWEDFFRFYPVVWLDMPSMWQRVQTKRHQEFDADIETRGYPNYYLQNFHHQTNGYLSDLSANLYDLQVELLFNGAADPMRRRVLAPLKEGLKTFSNVAPNQIKVLDVACGTGRTLKNLRGMLPKAALYGTDLSPAYLRKANQLLSQNAGELPQLVQANAEELPFLDNYFHGVTCVFLFHELPAQARQNVINNCFRVVKPGGTFVICDSIQVSDSPDLAPLMENFPEMFHEPYYRHYSADNLEARLQEAGFTDISTQVHFMSKYWIAHKPAEGQPEASQQVNQTVFVEA